MVTAGLNDPRVSYWEPAKWVAKLRTMKKDSNLLLLKTNMGAGHFGLRPLRAIQETASTTPSSSRPSRRRAVTPGLRVPDRTAFQLRGAIEWKVLRGRQSKHSHNATERYHRHGSGHPRRTPVFRGTRVPFQALLDYLEGGETIDEFLTITRRSQRKRRLRRSNWQKHCSSANWDEDPAGRVSPAQAQVRIPRSRLQTVPEAGLAGKKNGLLLSLAEDAAFDLFLTMERACNTSRIWPVVASRF